MSTALSISMLADSNDPLYGGVYQLLQRNYIGSWADAGHAYAKVRRDLLWAEIRALLSLKPTEGNKGKMATLLQELEHVSADLTDTEASSTSSAAAAQALVKTWATPVKAAKPSAPKNAFAALLEDSDEE